MVTGFDLIGHNRPLQEHWARRTLAFFVDLLLVLVPLWFFFTFINVRDIVFIGLSSSVAFYLYSAISEALWYKTPGKAAFGLAVRSTSGDFLVSKAFVRNVPKIFWYLFPFFDVLLGLATEGDPRQRLFDKITKTTVIHSWAQRIRESTVLLQTSQASKGVHWIGSAACRSCTGSLIDIGDHLLQCQRCGLIQ